MTSIDNHIPWYMIPEGTRFYRRGVWGTVVHVDTTGESESPITVDIDGEPISTCRTAFTPDEWEQATVPLGSFFGVPFADMSGSMLNALRTSLLEAYNSTDGNVPLALSLAVEQELEARGGSAYGKRV